MRYKVQSDTSPDACQGTKYQSDVNTWDTGFGATNLSGRLAGVEYHVCTYNGDGTLEKDRTIREMYSYSVGGRPLKKRMQLQRTDPLGGSGGGPPITGIANLDAEYTWSAEGTLLTLKYPDLRTGHPNQMLAEKGNTITYQTDWLRRYSGMTEATALNPNSPVTLVSNMQYGISGELTSMTYNQPSQSSHPVVTETRQYNLLGQLTQITAVQGANTVTNLQYVFPTGKNNGRISSMVNVQSGETVTYTYDALNRLTNAVGSGWSEAYVFDGFGNLTQKGGQSIGVLAASNRLTGPGVAYDSNGNQTGMQVGTTNVTNTFDIENRLLEVSGQGFRYGFGPDNRKMWTRNASNGNEDYVFWGPQGKPIGTYRAAWEWTASSGTLWFNAVVSTRRWMGSKEISATSVLIHDRLSSVVGVSAGGAVSRFRYLPYGEPNTAGGTPVGSHFATYDRTDAAMYYADQRYYRDGVRRFLSADPYQASGGFEAPPGWNRYSYVTNDPVNKTDPSGLQERPTYCDQFPTLPECTGFRQCPDGSWVLHHTLCPGEYPGDIRPPEVCNPGPGCPGDIPVAAPPPGENSGTTRLGQQLLTDALSKIDKKFADQLERNIPGLRGKLTDGKGDLQFWDARPGIRGGQGHRTAESIVGPGGSQKTIGELTRYDRAMVIRKTDGAITNHIILGATLFSLDSRYQLATVYHEAMHAILKREDLDLATAILGSGSGTQGQASVNLQKWLDGCFK